MLPGRNEILGRLRPRWPVIAALLLAAVQAVLLVRTAVDKSDTIDEPHYLAVAVRQWRLGDLQANCEAPALPKWAFGLALRAVDPELFREEGVRGWDPLWSRRPEELRRNLLAGRVATIAVVVAGGLALWRAALAFGAVAALVTHALYCLSPTVLAHGSLATLDGWVTALLCFVILASTRMARAPTLPRAALVGIGLGLAAACKVTSLAALPVGLAVLAWAVRSRAAAAPWIAPALRAGAALLLGLLVALWATYGFGVGTVDVANPCRPEFRGGAAAARTMGPLPFPEWIAGVLAQARHGRAGHLNYLFGEVKADGWWWFYLAAMALKTTVGAQALAIFAAAVALRRGRGLQARIVDLVILAPAIAMLVVLSLGNTQNGIKYLLPAFPFFMLWLGRVAAEAVSLGRAAAVAVALCLTAGAAESVRLHPHHLMFFNLWAGGPDNGPRYLVVGDDWGQDQRRLGEWQVENRPPTLYYTFYSGRPEYWQVTWQPVPCEPRPGFYALHAVEVHRPKRTPRGCLDWLTVEEPDDRLGYSIYLYKVTRARIERLVAARGKVRPFWTSAGPAPEVDAE